MPSTNLRHQGRWHLAAINQPLRDEGLMFASLSSDLHAAAMEIYTPPKVSSWAVIMGSLLTSELVKASFELLDADSCASADQDGAHAYP